MFQMPGAGTLQNAVEKKRMLRHFSVTIQCCLTSPLLWKTRHAIIFKLPCPVRMESQAPPCWTCVMNRQRVACEPLRPLHKAKHFSILILLRESSSCADRKILKPGGVILWPAVSTWLQFQCLKMSEGNPAWQPQWLKAKSDEKKSQRQQHLATQSDLVKELWLQLRQLLIVGRAFPMNGHGQTDTDRRHTAPLLSRCMTPDLQ